MDLQSTNIYVVHAVTGFEAREKSINDLLHKKHQLKFQYVTESASSSENDKWISDFFVPGIKNRISKGAIFCTLVHLLIYERFLKSQEKYAIIFENDICFLKPFSKNINKVIDEASTLPEGFIISLENSTLRFPSWRKVKKDKYVYEASRCRCAGAYLIDRAAALTMLEDAKINKCDRVIDWWHDDLIKREKVKIYWAHPPLTEQGSSSGKVASSSSGNQAGNLLYFRWTMQKFYKMYILRWFR